MKSPMAEVREWWDSQVHSNPHGLWDLLGGVVFLVVAGVVFQYAFGWHHILRYFFTGT